MSSVIILLNNFLNSWYGVAVLLGGVLIVATHASIGKFIERLTLRFQRENLLLATGSEAAEQVEAEDTEEYKKIQASLSELHMNADKEFADFLESVKYHLLNHPITKKEVRRLIQTIFTVKEQYEFAYLNLFLVANTKRALMVLSDLESATKEILFSHIHLPNDIQDHTGQKEVIFNVLLCHHLVQFDHGLCSVSEKGERYLEFLGIM